MNAVTFGSLSKFYALMTHDLQAKVAQNFAGVNECQLEQYLNVITKFRNVCAHNERLFSYQTYSDIPDTTLHQIPALLSVYASTLYSQSHNLPALRFEFYPGFCRHGTLICVDTLLA